MYNKYLVQFKTVSGSRIIVDMSLLLTYSKGLETKFQDIRSQVEKAIGESTYYTYKRIKS